LSGLSDTGYEPRTQAEILESQQAFLRATISEKLILTDRTVLGNWTRVGSDHLALLEEAQQESYNAYDRDAATSDRLSSLAILLGVPRRENPTQGLVSVTLDLDAGQTFVAGSIEIQVVGEPDNIWSNRDTVTSTGAGSYSAVFISDLTGSLARAASGTLTELLTPTDGTVNSATNASDAQPGRDRETDAELRVRMAQAVAAGAQNTAASIRAALVQVPGVLSADVFENRTGTVDANGVQGHSIRCVVWDGNPALALSTDIAQVIYDRAATFAQGAVTAAAQDETLGAVLVNFDRATASAITVAINVQSAVGVAEADVVAALQAAMPGIVGKGITLEKLAAGALSVPGVDGYASFTINGGSSDLPDVQTIIYTLDSSDVGVTGDVS
jgi:uncharacterized phage protein gp47/JayE